MTTVLVVLFLVIGVQLGVVADMRGCSHDITRSLLRTNDLCSAGLARGIGDAASNDSAAVGADDVCSSTPEGPGIGSVYGQLVVIGYKEYRLAAVNETVPSAAAASTDCEWLSYGLPNCTFVMNRR